MSESLLHPVKQTRCIGKFDFNSKRRFHRMDRSSSHSQLFSLASKGRPAYASLHPCNSNSHVATSSDAENMAVESNYSFQLSPDEASLVGAKPVRSPHNPCLFTPHSLRASAFIAPFELPSETENTRSAHWKDVIVSNAQIKLPCTLFSPPGSALHSAASTANIIT